MTKPDEFGFEDILYDKDDGVAVITMNRPDRMNAFRARTCDELVEAFRDSWADRTIGAVILTGFSVVLGIHLLGNLTAGFPKDVLKLLADASPSIRQIVCKNLQTPIMILGNTHL